MIVRRQRAPRGLAFRAERVEDFAMLRPGAIARPAFLALLLVTAGATLAVGEEMGAPGVFVPPAPREGFTYPPCYCTDTEGRRVEIGETACLTIAGKAVTALCRMSLNNPAWRTLEDGCPTS
jgi:hypothetical protein